MDDVPIQASPNAMATFGFDYRTISVPPNLRLVNQFELSHESVNPYPSLHPTNLHALTSDYATSSGLSFEVESPESSDFSNTVLKYINDMLMEEELESSSCILHDCLALQVAEKSFYDVLGQTYPPPPDQSFGFDQNNHSLDSTVTWSAGTSDGYSNYTTYIDSVESSWIFGQAELEFSHVPEDTIQAPDLYSESIINFGSLIPLFPSESQDKDYARDHSSSQNSSRERKQHQREGSVNLEGRSNKHSAFSVEKGEQIEIFDEVLLHRTENNDSALSASALKNSLPNRVDGLSMNKGQTKGSNSRTIRSKKQGRKKEVVDLLTLLPQCARAVANDDQKTAKELLKQIRQYSSPCGDGNQRLAHYFVNGLEARMAGTGMPGYTPAVRSTTSAADMLKGYHTYIKACPFQTMSFLYANQTILKLAEKVSRLHIIDFGVLYGFQWPSLIEHLSTRPGGPPKLCITGIEFPQPGFRPAERVEEAGRRLRKYCERFNVQFEYNSIAQKWETIQYEDLRIDRDELTVVNCLYRLKNLPDDTMVAAHSARDIVLNLIRRINPDIFIHGVVNGSYNAPFFLTRFRDALFHFSAVFDLLDTTIPREEPEREMFERETFGRYAVNVLACEGWERVERPETYKQWQAREQRVGFRKIPLDKELMKKIISIVKSNYNKNFIVDEDNQWMLQGWKGRIIYALSVWKPVYD